MSIRGQTLTIEKGTLTDKVGVPFVCLFAKCMVKL